MASKNRIYDAALTRLNAYIKQEKMRVSPVRRMVLEKVCLLKQPFTAEQLIQACAEERISDATIYNALTLFITARILHANKRQRGQTSTEYELTIGAHTRMQIICQKCGRITSFHDKAIEQIVKEHKYYNFNFSRFSMFVYGECKHCRKPQREE